MLKSEKSKSLRQQIEKMANKPCNCINRKRTELVATREEILSALRKKMEEITKEIKKQCGKDGGEIKLEEECLYMKHVLAIINKHLWKEDRK